MSTICLMMLGLLAQPAEPAHKEKPKDAPKLYFKQYDEPDLKLTIRELRRTKNTSTLDIKVIKSDAQGGPFATVYAASVIAKELKLRYFTPLHTEIYEGGHGLTIYFTGDPKEEPPKEMSEEHRQNFARTGYLDSEPYLQLMEMQKQRKAEEEAKKEPQGTKEK